MAAPKGSKYWQLADKMGRHTKYTSATLWQKAVEYFEWVDANPLVEEKISAGAIVKINKMRAMTIRGLCLYAGIDQQTFANYESREDFFGIATRIRDVIYTQKFEGASADLLNPNIIARELGLVDKTELTGKDGNPLIPTEVRKNTEAMSPVDIAKLLCKDGK